jgi:hypothetical protein
MHKYIIILIKKILIQIESELELFEAVRRRLVYLLPITIIKLKNDLEKRLRVQMKRLKKLELFFLGFHPHVI